MRFRSTLLMAVASICALAQTTTPTTRQMMLPPVGLGSTETAEIILVNTAANSSAGTAASCAGNVAFQNASGATIGTAATFAIASGQSSTARLAFSAAGITGNRGIIRPVLSVTIPTTTPRPPCSLAVSFSVYDTTTGATHAVITTSEAGFSHGGGRRH